MKKIKIKFTQKMADDINKVRKELGFDKFPKDHPLYMEESKPHEMECLFG